MFDLVDRITYKDAAKYYHGKTAIKKVDKRLLCVHVAMGRCLEQLETIGADFKQIDKKTYKKSPYTNCIENFFGKAQIIATHTSKGSAFFLRYLLGAIIHPSLVIKDLS